MRKRKCESKRMSRLLLGVCIALSAASPSSGEVYKINDLLTENPSIETFDSLTGIDLDPHRKLKLDVGFLSSINATTDTCKTAGPNMKCHINTMISADDGTRANLNILVQCPLDSQLAFDFRRALGCSCGASITHSNGGQKYCPCVVCPYKFGVAPISLDCSMRQDPFIIDKCSSIDCGFACNGTCEFNCRNSGPSCEFCSPGPRRPTAAPTFGNGTTQPPSLVHGKGKKNRTQTSSAPQSMSIAGALAAVSLSTLYALL